MEFIEHRGGGGDEKSQESSVPRAADALAKGAAKKGGEDRIFGEVRAFPDKKLD